jgi:hypothetical protein
VLNNNVHMGGHEGTGSGRSNPSGGATGQSGGSRTSIDLSHRSAIALSGGGHVQAGARGEEFAVGMGSTWEPPSLGVAAHITGGGIDGVAVPGVLTAILGNASDAYFIEEGAVLAVFEEPGDLMAAARLEQVESQLDSNDALAMMAFLLGGYWAHTGEEAGRNRQKAQRPR